MTDEIATFAALVDEPLELHSIEPWIIARAEPQREALAKEWLMRHGFEVYYPTCRHIRTVPLRRLPAKTRHKRKHELVETIRPAFPGYVFVRRMFGAFDVNRLFEVPHVLGTCCFGIEIATLADYEIEAMRMDEARGRYDVYGNVAAAARHRYELAQLLKTGAPADKRWTGVSRIVGRACESGALVTFIEAFGRITRVLTAPAAGGASAARNQGEALPAPRRGTPSGGTTPSAKL